jgi:hypothetical protein
MLKQVVSPAKKLVCTSQISHCHIQGERDLKRHLVLSLASEPVISRSHQLNVGSILYREIILSESYQLPPLVGLTVILTGLIHVTAHIHGRIVAGGYKCDCPINVLLSTMALGSTQPLNRNEYQVYFLGVKSAGA